MSVVPELSAEANRTFIDKTKILLSAVVRNNSYIYHWSCWLFQWFTCTYLSFVSLFHILVIFLTQDWRLVPVGQFYPAFDAACLVVARTLLLFCFYNSCIFSAYIREFWSDEDESVSCCFVRDYVNYCAARGR